MSIFGYTLRMKALIKIDPKNPAKKTILRAAAILKRGGIVVFPTETVYGLGANVFSRRAVRKIFAAKGRPADNPLIVHVASVADVKLVAREAPAVAQKLMRAFWPGPMALVLEKRARVPDEVTAGSNSVAVRMPAHAVARALIRACGFPIAAPSANKAGRPSPTSARHVAEDFGMSSGERQKTDATIDLILDGGKTRIGLESTVVDARGAKAVILRSGGVTVEDLQKVLGYKPKIARLRKGGKAPSPGMKYRHYAPSMPLILIGLEPRTKSATKKMIVTMQKKIHALANEGLRVGVLCTSEHAKFYKEAHQIMICGSLGNPDSIAKNLFASLRRFQKRGAGEKSHTGIDLILSENFREKGIGHGVMDRLKRAAAVE